MLNVYAILDVKAEFFGQLFTFPADGVALRFFCELAHSEGSNVAKYPEDFSLYRIAVFDEKLGSIKQEREDFVLLATASQFVRPEKTPEKTPEKEPEKTPEKEPEKTPEKEPEKTPEKEPEKESEVNNG